MTTRLVFLDLSSAEYFALRASLVARSVSEDLTPAKRKYALGLVDKLDSAWDVKGREGRGLNTRLPKRNP